MTGFRIIARRLAEAEVAALADAQQRELALRYGDDPDALEAALPSEEFEPAQRGIFVVGALADRLVACGGIRHHEPGIAEMKRLYTVPDARGAGHARAIVAALEGHARAFGYGRLRLETGTLQPEALALYQSVGYERIEPYGPWKDSPLSVCLEKCVG